MTRGAQKPALFTTAPVAAIRKVPDKVGWESSAGTPKCDNVVTWIA